MQLSNLLVLALGALASAQTCAEYSSVESSLSKCGASVAMAATESCTGTDAKATQCACDSVDKIQDECTIGAKVTATCLAEVTSQFPAAMSTLVSYLKSELNCPTGSKGAAAGPAITPGPALYGIMAGAAGVMAVGAL